MNELLVEQLFLTWKIKIWTLFYLKTEKILTWKTNNHNFDLKKTLIWLISTL